MLPRLSAERAKVGKKVAIGASDRLSYFEGYTSARVACGPRGSVSIMQSEPTTSSSNAPSQADDALVRFLDANGMQRLMERLSGQTLAYLSRLLFSNGRAALLQALTDCGLKLPERQQFANKLGAASRSGAPGIAETDEDIRARTAWLDETQVPATASGAWPRSSRPFLIFTSAGDASSVSRWVEDSEQMRDWLDRETAFGGGGGRRDFDLCVAYYGEKDSPSCLHVADRSVRMRGGKFPNLLQCMRQQREYFAGFEAILVADDGETIYMNACAPTHIVVRSDACALCSGRDAMPRLCLRVPQLQLSVAARE